MRNSIFTGIRKGGLIFTLIGFLAGLSNIATAQIQRVERKAPPMEQLPQEQNQLAVSYDDDINEDELPEPVISSINDNYPGFEPAEIYRGSDGSYKVKLEKEDEKMTVFYNEGGEFIRVEKDEDEDNKTTNDD